MIFKIKKIYSAKLLLSNTLLAFLNSSTEKFNFKENDACTKFTEYTGAVGK